MDQELLPGIESGHWRGTSELWLDPLGNDVLTSDCELAVSSDEASYTWSKDDKHHEGRFTLGDDGAVFWSDSFHQSEPTRQQVREDWSLLSLFYSYGAGEGPDWGWRMAFSERPDGSLVLQMTNVTPWGEEGRAVRMVLERLA